MYLAQQGFAVDAIDFVPAALAATQARAEQAGVELALHQSDVVDYAAPAPYDLVLDSGCLHHLPNPKRAAVPPPAGRVARAGGDYVLVHFAHRPRVGWIPKGPKHLTRDQAVAFFAPLELQAYDEIHYDVPFPMGRMRAGVYWFSESPR